MLAAADVLCQRLRPALLCGMIVFAPWAFGSTEPWSIAIMNGAAYLAGALWVVACAAKWGRGWRPQWHSKVVMLAALCLFLLSYVLISALNAAAIYKPHEWRLEPLPHIPWLPHSYDAPSTWAAFRVFVALAFVFWSTWDWLSESRDPIVPGQAVPRVTSRLRTLLWVLCVNGALVSLEAIIQRTAGTPDLLFFRPTHDNYDAAAQFGPYAYRANGAQFLNLIWPVALGFWWWLHNDRTQSRVIRQCHHILLACVFISAAGALYSLSRGGAAVAALLLCAGAVLFAVKRHASTALRLGAVAITTVTLAIGFYMSWEKLGRRFANSGPDFISGRSETYALAVRMHDEHPVFGTGAGTFNYLFQLYRTSPDQYWPAQLHNDWLEFRITFGWIGFSAILAALLIATLSWLRRGGVPRDALFLWLTTFALGGCLLHARFDFPLQIYSIQFVFVLLAAILFSSARHGPGRA